MSTIAYRPDIDGLRAVAVLSVLLCHANIAGFSGGFVGVDVFFVISGFLITSLIMTDLRAGTFSLIDFWERRCRRILPPLALVMAATAVAGWVFLLPADYARLGQQLAAQAVFASNILFKTQAGYFDSESQTKPLLHTWSLAVEEQFYIVLPVVLFLLWRFRQDKIVRVLAIIAIVTFIASAIIIRNSPSSAFFLQPFRAWELLIGALLALRPPALPSARGVNETLAAGGLLVILLPVFFYNDDTFFPGFAALAPCLGAAAIILAGMRGQTMVGRLLSLRGVVFVGLISYSLYLWHWPFIAFAKYSEVIPFTLNAALFCMAMSFLLAVVTWQWVEKPVRRRHVLKTTRGAYIASLLVLLTAAGGGFVIQSANGFPARIDPVIVQLADGVNDSNPHRKECDKPDFSRFDNNTICQLNAGARKTPDHILWGDSLADALAPAFYEMAKVNGANGYVVTAHGCPPILGFNRKEEKSFDCAGFNDRVLSLIDRGNIKTVYLAGKWIHYINGDNYVFGDTPWYGAYKDTYPNLASAAFKRTLDELGRRGIAVHVILDTPYAPFDPPRYLSLRMLYKAFWLPDAIPLKPYMDARAGTIDDFIRTYGASGPVRFIDPRAALCDDKECRVHENGHSLYYNPGHLSAYGARTLIPLLEGR